MSNKKIRGHCTCLRDIVQNIAKMNIFAHFLRGTWGEFYKSWRKSNQLQPFQLILKYQLAI